ncbi:hypothetical protein L9F63_024677, partial [Diploptera punctata]
IIFRTLRYNIIYNIAIHTNNIKFILHSLLNQPWFLARHLHTNSIMVEAGGSHKSAILATLVTNRPRSFRVAGLYYIYRYDIESSLDVALRNCRVYPLNKRPYYNQVHDLYMLILLVYYLVLVGSGRLVVGACRSRGSKVLCRWSSGSVVLMLVAVKLEKTFICLFT